MRGPNEVNEENEHAKHLYLRQLVERDGRDPKTAGKAADTILGFERSTGFKSFKRSRPIRTAIQAAAA